MFKVLVIRGVRIILIVFFILIMVVVLVWEIGWFRVCFFVNVLLFVLLIVFFFRGVYGVLYNLISKEYIKKIMKKDRSWSFFKMSDYLNLYLFYGIRLDILCFKYFFKIG